jgi:hypothetical protein
MTVEQENKITLYAPIQIDESVSQQAQEKASVLAFPDERQNDLQYIRSILVSAGTNKNGAHFMPSEMLKAHDTVVNKAIDIEHEEDKVIGHIYDCAFLHKDGEQFDPPQLMIEAEEAGTNLDDLDIDIVITGVIHKMRFPELADEISSGDWKVSMECYFKDFDIKIGDTIISRQEAQLLGYDPNELVGNFVKITAENKELGTHSAARVLRGITFSGMGLVKNPANPHSIILETAEVKEKQESNTAVIELEQIEALRNKEAAEEEGELEAVKAAAVDVEKGETGPQFYIEVDEEVGGIKRILSVDGNSETAASRWSGNGIGAPGSITSWPDEICKSFKKRATRYNALDQSEAQVLHEHYCALFEEPCPVIGATAKAPECLRNARNRTIRDDQDNTLTKIHPEYMDGTPRNTFVTVPLPDGIPTYSVASVDVKEQNERIITEARTLRASLRDFVSAEKKTLE